LGLRLCVALDQPEGMFLCLVTEAIVQQHARPSEDDVQRRAQFVRQHRQEFVLQTIRFPEAAFGPLMRQVGDDDGDGSDALDVQSDG
jgi:hypothetical protein